MGACSHRRAADAKDCGDLDVVQVLEVPQGQHRALIEQEPLECLLQFMIER